MSEYIIRYITPSDDPKIAEIIRNNLRKFHLDIPGTVYFDKELDTLSTFYAEYPEKRRYCIMTDENGSVVGGVGIAEFEHFEDCAELQKLYLCDEVKGRGLGKKLLQTAEETARMLGYAQLYLETHTNLKAAIGLYENSGYRLIEKPSAVCHGTMDRFYIKELY